MPTTRDRVLTPSVALFRCAARLAPLTKPGGNLSTKMQSPGLSRPQKPESISSGVTRL